MPPKRQRKQSESSDVRTRSTYWFDDGNIVLQAEDTLFKVHRSMLTRHSEVFKDTLSLPQPPDGQTDEIIEDCPVIVLSDATNDVENMLSLFYDNFMTNNANKLSIDAVVAMLRLGKKYTIPHFEREALSRLRHDYPEDLASWDILLDPTNRQIAEGDPPVITTVKAIALAVENQLYGTLPAAYARLLDESSLTWLTNNATAYITPRARDQCITGLVKMTNFIKEKQADAFCPPGFIPARSCSTDSKCRKYKALKELSIWTTYVDTCHSFGILHTWLWIMDAKPDLCSNCTKEARKLVEKIRQEFWTRLPTFFELEAWENLEE